MLTVSLLKSDNNSNNYFDVFINTTTVDFVL